MRARLIGNDVQHNAKPNELRINVGRVPDEPDAEHLTLGAGLFDELECIIKSLRDLHEITGLNTPTYAVDINLHAQSHTLVHLDRERLRTPHPAHPCGQDNATAQRPP